jgi:hypothetical protein
MRKIILNEKSGFASQMPFKIFEPNGNLFYSDTFTKVINNGNILQFNLPAGEYEYDGNFIKLPNPVKVINVPLPMKERNLAHGRYQIIFGNNPNKCTIFYDDSVILFDNSFKNEPLFYKYCVYFHELGHHWYVTEYKADLYSCKKMLDYGFNPTQIALAIFDSLSEKQRERKLSIINNLTKNLG